MAQTITFNEQQDFDYIFTTTSGGTVYSANRAASTVFDYFSDSAVVNDAIYFSLTYGNSCSDLQFNIGTAVAATTFAVAWERWTGSIWTAISGLVDNTNSFQNTGVRTVTFPVFNATQKIVNGGGNFTIRARITTVTGITEGGANSTATVKNRDWAITIANPGATTTGFNAALYAADIAGGWGVCTKQGNNQYFYNCHIKVGYAGDASLTTISDSDVCMNVKGGIMAKKFASVIQLGTLVNDSKRITSGGCFLKMSREYWSQYWADGTSWERWVFYSTVVNATPYVIIKAYNATLTGGFHTGGTVLYNVSYTGNPDWTGSSQYVGSSVRKILLQGGTNGPRQEFSDYLRDFVLVGATYSGYVGTGATNLDYDNTTINLISDGTGIYWQATPTDGRARGVYISRQNTVNLTVKNGASAIQNANITLLDGNGYNAAYKEVGYCNPIAYTITSLTTTSGSFAIGDTLRIGAEKLTITAGTNPWTVTRAVEGTVAATQANNYSKIVQKLYPIVQTDVNGLSGEILVENSYQKWASGTLPGVTTTVSRNPFTLNVKKYGYNDVAQTMTISGTATTSGEVNSSIGLIVDPVIVKSEAAASAITGITIDHAASTITITANTTIRDLYDYIHYNINQSTNPLYATPMTSADGVNFSSPYSVTVNTGVALSGTFALTLSGGATLTMNGTATSSGNITHTTGTKVWTRIALSGLTANSRVQLYDSTSSTELYNAVVAGTSLEYQTDWTTDHTIRYRISYVNGATAKNFIEASGTFSSGGLSVAIAQTDDAVYIANAISGSTVTGITITPSPARVKINLAGGTVSWASIYAYQVYWLYGATGIADEAAFIIASDTANYTLYGFDIRNDSATALTLTGGWGKDSVTDTIAGVIDVAGSTGNIYAEPDHIIPYGTQLSGAKIVQVADKISVIL